jgi:hypothetical protein
MPGFFLFLGCPLAAPEESRDVPSAACHSHDLKGVCSAGCAARIGNNLFPPHLGSLNDFDGYG